MRWDFTFNCSAAHGQTSDEFNQKTTATSVTSSQKAELEGSLVDTPLVSPPAMTSQLSLTASDSDGLETPTPQRQQSGRSKGRAALSSPSLANN
eukprot:800989-Amphidinium_carterae.1